MEDKRTKEDESMDKMCDLHVFEHKGIVYHMAIIDFLQDWNLFKKLERFTMTSILQKPGG